MDCEFAPINMDTWARREMFYVYTKLTPSGYSLTVDVDITNTRKLLKEKSIKLFPAYVWTATNCINEQESFKVAYKDGILGIYNHLVPLYPCFHEDDHTDSLMWGDCSRSFQEFYREYIDKQNKYGGNHGAIAIPGEMPPANGYSISCIPWISFKHFSLHMFANGGYFFPVIESGRYYEKSGRVFLPVSITAHHATVDGWHISSFFKSLQHRMDHPEEWI